jgi:hypothetical protein
MHTMGTAAMAVVAPHHNDRHDHRHLVTQIALALMLAFAMLASIASFSAQDASAGQVGYINTEGAALMVHPTDLSVIDWMHQGAAVDILFGPYDGMYEVRYYGVDGWVWAEYLGLDGGTTAVGGGASYDAAPVAAPVQEEHWIDVNRSTGAVSLMVGNTVQATYWASMGYDPSADGFYSTAVGTYYIYAYDASLHYTPFADNYITNWVAFDSNRFNGFHSYTKDAAGNILPNGGGLTGGCVALAPGDIDALFAFAEMGMRVEVHF